MGALSRRTIAITAAVVVVAALVAGLVLLALTPGLWRRRQYVRRAGLARAGGTGAAAAAWEEMTFARTRASSVTAAQVSSHEVSIPRRIIPPACSAPARHEQMPAGSSALARSRPNQ